MTELFEAARLLGVTGRQEGLAPGIELLSQVSEGLPLRSLDVIANAIAPDDATFRYRIVPKATLARARHRRRLNPTQGVVVTRLARLWTQALHVWKSPAEARGFLNRPHELLDGRRPIDVALDNEIGARLVEDILGRLEHGTAV